MTIVPNGEIKGDVSAKANWISIFIYLKQLASSSFGNSTNSSEWKKRTKQIFKKVMISFPSPALTHYTLTQANIFFTLFSLHFPPSALTTKSSVKWWLFPGSHDTDVWFKSDIVRRNWMLVTLWGGRVKHCHKKQVSLSKHC